VAMDAVDGGGGDGGPWRGRLRPWVEWIGFWRLVGAALTVVALVVVGWWLVRPADPPTEAGLPYASPPSVDSTPPATISPPLETGPAVLVVHVAGAVVTPGVYELPAGTRVEGAVAAAGGALAEADPSALNLAAAVGDGQRVYVPRVGEVVVAPVGGGGPDGGSAPPSGPVDVNRAGVEELDGLPGIGPATAQAIVAHRDQHGPFASVEDLEAVRGIGPAKLDALRGLVTV